MFRGQSAKFFPALLVCLLMLSCARNFVPQAPVRLAVEAPRADDALYLQWLGASTWVVARGKDVVVVDPFFTRPSFVSVAFSLVFRGLFGEFGYDAERIKDVLPDLPANTGFVLLGHAHYDHLMDVPYYLTRDSGQSATYLGGPTARNILMGFKPARLDFTVAEEARPSRKGGVRVTAFPSDHAPHFLGLKLMSGAVEKPMTTAPRRAGHYVEGETLVYFIDFLDAGNRVSWRVFVGGAASSPEAAEALRKHADFLRERAVDVAILCVPGWDKVDDYPDSVLGVLNPANVVLSHYDDFGSPYLNGEDPKKEMRFVPLAGYDGFVTKLRNLKEKHQYRFQIHEPKTGQCIGFPASGPRLKCEE